MSISTSRRGFLKMGVTAITMPVWLGLTGCQAVPPLKIASQVWPGYSFLYLAEQEGLFDRQRIQLIETQNLAESSLLLSEGQVDGAALTLDEVLHIMDMGIALKVILILDSSVGADVVMANPSITRLEQLKGKKIGVETSTLGTIMFAELLKASHLNREDVEYIPISTDHIYSWEQEKMDVIITYTPISDYFEKQGLINIFDSRQFTGRIIDVLAVRSEVAQTHQQAVSALVRGHFLALEQWRNNPFDTHFILAEILKLNPEESDRAFRGLNLPDFEFNYYYLTPPATELKRAAHEIAQIMLNNQLISQIPVIDDVFVADFLPGV
jgi:NitT/TauT family transport system substrate-binding protein